MAALLAGVGAAKCRAQYLEASISIDAAATAASVRGRWVPAASGRRNLSFRLSAAGAPDLGRRISNVKLADAAGVDVPFRAFNSAEYVASADFASFSYTVDLQPLADPRSAAHASWIGSDAGVIYLDDILPLAAGDRKSEAAVSLSTPTGWELLTTDMTRKDGRFAIRDTGSSVFVFAKGLRRMHISAVPGELTLGVVGQWLFDDAEAAKMAADVFAEYGRAFGAGPDRPSLVVLLPLPQNGVAKGVWEAETRGSTALIASSDMAFKTQSLQRVHEQLRHEIFHFWLPNGVSLTGPYDWFYEGFALYQSLKTGVAVNRIRFDDFLDALSRAHHIDRLQAQRRSLLDASRQRWAGDDTQLYARGMVMAFLTDVTLLRNSNGKNSVEKFLSGLFLEHKYPAPPADANTAVLGYFDADPNLKALADAYIRGADPVDWAGIIAAAGLENELGTSRTRLRIKAKLTGKQKAVLDKLGYNNWRKLTRQ